MKPVCLVIGAGAGIGGSVGARFARGDYHSVLCRRSDQAGLDKLVGNIKAGGDEASGFLLDVTQADVIEDLVARIERDIGAIDVVIFNLGAQIGNRTLADTSYKAFEMGWRLATFALYRVAKSVLPYMEARETGTMIVTSATAAMRGNAGQHSHAAAMGGRRLLCQSLNAEFAPKGIHIAQVVIDGSVDAPDTLGKMLGEKDFQKLRETRGGDNDGILLPKEIAETYWHLAHQHRSAWTHELDLRPRTDAPWWNDNPTFSY